MERHYSRGHCEKSLALLEKEKKQKQVTFYKDYHSEILKGCTQPDEENDMDKGHGKHYYSCVNPKGKELPETNGYYRNRFGDLAVSARTCLEENYTAAVSLYKSGDIKTPCVFSAEPHILFQTWDALFTLQT